MTVWRIVDLFSCSGGSSWGYRAAGLHVTGLDRDPQPRFAGDVFEHRHPLDITPEELRARFDAIHASPPCQGLTEMNNDKSRHVNLIPRTRALAEASGLPYQIENVRGARQHLINPVSLTGQMFDLHLVTSGGQRFDLDRERLFEVNWPLPRLPAAPCRYPVANVFGGHLRARGGQYRTGGKTGRTVDFPGENRPVLARQLMGMPWATMGEMSEAVPPAYTEWIGRRLIEHLEVRAH